MDELIIEAKTENLESVLNFVAGKLETADCPEKLRTQISIVIEEIFVNIARYAYAPSTGGAAVRVAVGEEEIAVEFEDSGQPYNPLENEAPDIRAGVEERRIGGLGIYMVKNMADATEYRREGNKNILTVRKKRTYKSHD